MYIYAQARAREREREHTDTIVGKSCAAQISWWDLMEGGEGQKDSTSQCISEMQIYFFPIFKSGQKTSTYFQTPLFGAVISRPRWFRQTARLKWWSLIFRQYTRVEQALFDDIKILGHQVGHFISIFQAIWDTSLTHEARKSEQKRMDFIFFCM